MAVLDLVLQEELDRIKKIKAVMEKELGTMPIGYLSKKMINNKSYFYLQRREGGKIVGTYVKPNDVDKFKEQIERRKQLEKSIRQINENIKKIERVIR